jgi:hypothetical protein
MMLQMGSTAWRDPKSWRRVCYMMSGMNSRPEQLTVVVGASQASEPLRRSLMQRGMPHLGTAGHLRGLRRWLVLSPAELVVICVTLDQHTVRRYGDVLRTLLSDLHMLPAAVQSVGLLVEPDSLGSFADLGCDMYVNSCVEAHQIIGLLHDERMTPPPFAWLRLSGDAPSSGCDEQRFTQRRNPTPMNHFDRTRDHAWPDPAHDEDLDVLR